jgi:hypothetical protein
MEEAGILNGHFVYFIANWNILCPFDIFYGNLVYFLFWYIFPILVCCTKKNLATLLVEADEFNLLKASEKT